MDIKISESFGYWRPWVRVPPLRPFLAVLTAERPQGSNTLRSFL